MKQPNGWSKPSPRGGPNRGQRRSNGGSYSLKYQRNNNFRPPKASNFFETIKERLNFTFKNLAGQAVKLKKSNGLILQGVLIASNNESVSGTKITLQYVKVLKRPEGNKEVIPTGDAKYVIPWSDLAYVLGSDESVDAPSSGRLKTDADITSSNIKAGKISGRRLQAPDANWLKKPKKPVEMDSKEKGGAWDQFKVNEEKFGVKGTYKEELYTTNLDKSALTPEQIQKAEETAREIENKTSTNPHLREERNQKVNGGDEEARYSAVIRNPPVPAPPKVKSNQPLNFAAALMKGKQVQQPTTKERFQTPLKQQLQSGSQEKRDPAAKPETAALEKKVSKNSKYKVSDVDFSALKKAAHFKRAMLTPSSKNWEAHNFTKKKLEAGKGKSREEQINEFKKFSSSLDTKKSKKSLNVNAKEFKPTQPPPMVINQEVQQQEQTDPKNKGKARQAPNANVHMGAPGYAQQPVWTMPMHPHMPVNFYHPVMIPGGGVYPQNANGNIMLPPGQPYVVHMIPPGGVHPYQGQRFPPNFPPQVVQVGPGMQAVGNEQLTEAQKQIMHQQMQQVQQAQQQQQNPAQQPQQIHQPKPPKQTKPRG